FTEGLARLAKHDASSQVSYIDTLKAFLDNNSSVAETARELHLHRSTLIDRIERIKQMIGSDLTDPGERLKLQMILYANAGEE
ncbi:MAG: helix-turn-helix domain-containing protein, partial [Clostridia bacterium]|nr:helix-turn-helix domain-containing protein [Clostridia bacterium]